MKSLSLVVLACTLAAPVFAALPTPVNATTARKYLDELAVLPPKTDPPYDRKLFTHWITVSGKCDTRETVLIRDGTNVKTNTATCTVLSGDWVSPYDDVSTTVPTDLDIDHVIPLKEAWVSGAWDWTRERRRELANDLKRPQLVAVTDNLNQQKGDKDPAKWMPPLKSFQCTYVSAWVEVKHYYDLAVDEDEKKALVKYLDACS